MRIRPGILIVVVAAFAVLIGGRFLGWFGGKPAEVAVIAEPSETGAGDTPVSASEQEPPATRPIGRIGSGMVKQPTVSAVPSENPVAPPAGVLIADWEQKIDDVLTGQEEDNQKAKRLLSIFPNLPEDGQVEAAQHLSNLLPDEDYAALKQTLTNAVMPEAVLDVLMTDVLNRPNQLKLEALLDVARIPNHPKGEEARDVLEVFVDENFGEDWAAWDAAVKKWLKENPDE